jgi:hypothetical protein
MLRAVNAEEDALFTSQPRLTLYAQLVRRLLIQRVRVIELADIILAEMGEVEWFEVPGTRRPRQLPVQYNSIASIPPADGTCHFDKLPAELLKAIFSASLPPRAQIIEPRCGGARTESLEKRELRPNRVADLMVLNKKLCEQVAEVLYEERTYNIHVHQGQMNAGIEFLHIGRQPLQYQADVKDARFAKFSPGEVFGFSRLKKMEISIYPGDGKCRHTAINTYYMLLALVNLLSNRENEPGNRITSLDIRFVATYSTTHNVMQGRSRIMTAESPWWDVANDKPRETSFHGISDIQLMLQPFARLFGVHNVDIIAPAKVAQHQPTVLFVRALKRCMQGRSQSATFNHTSLNAQLDGMRSVHEDYMLRVLYGGAMVEDEKLDDVRDEGDDNGDNDEDDDAGDGRDGGRRDTPHDAGKYDGPDNDGDDDNSDDDDDGDDGPDAGMLGGENVEHKKHGLSISPSNSNAGGGRKRVHLSDDTSSGDGPSGLGERSHMNLDDSSTSRDNVFGSRFLATEAEIDSMERFAMVCGTSEEDARFWLTRSNWDFNVAVLNFMASLEVENTRDEDGMRRAVALSLQDLMTAEGYPAPVRDRDMRAGRELDSRTSPTRSSRADGPSTRAGAQNQPTQSSSAYGPTARPVWPPRRLLASYARQDEEAEGMESNSKGKGKGKAKKTDDYEEEEDGWVWKDYSRYDESISRWNNPSNFSRQDDNFGPYNAYDTEMADAGWEPYPTVQAAASNPGGAAGPSQGPSLAEGNEFAELYTARVREWVAQESDADARDLDQEAAALLDVADSSRDLLVDRPQSQSYSGALETVYVPDREGGPHSQSHSGAPGSMYVPATAAPARPGSRLPRMNRPRGSPEYGKTQSLDEQTCCC